MVVLRCWGRVVSRAAGGSTPLLVGVGALAALLAAGWSWLVVGLYRQATITGVELAPEGMTELQRAVTGANTLSTFAIGASILLAIVALSPSQTAVHALVATRPVRPGVHLLGQSLPLLAASLLATAVLNGPAVAVYLTGTNRDPELPVPLEAVGLLVGAVAVDVIILVAVHAATAMCVLMRIHGAGVRRLFGLLGGAVVILMLMGHDLIALFQPKASLITTQPWLLFQRAGGGLWGATVLLGVPVLVISGGWVALAWLTRVSMRPSSVTTPVLLSRPHVRGAPRFTVLTVTELRVALRHPVLLASTLLGLILAVGCRVLLETLDHDQRQPVFMIAPMVVGSLAGLVAEGAYGRTASWHGLYRHQPRPAMVWFWPKVLANALYALVFGAIALMTLVAFTDIDVSSLGTELVWFVLLFATAFLAGVLVPYRDDVPFNAVITSALAVTISIAAYLGLGKLAEVAGFVPWIVCGVGIIAAALILAREVSC